MATPNSSNDQSIADLSQIRPLNARSLALSVLLGMHPPELSAANLVRLGELFGIADNTMRTALSRAVGNGELELADARYRLVGTLLERQQSQDLGRSSPESWSGDWITAIAFETGRSLAARRAFRSTMTNQRLGELRPDIWMRPANVAIAPLTATATATATATVLHTTGPIAGISDVALVASLWNVPAFAAVAQDLLNRCRRQLDELEWESSAAIVPSFQLAATTLRFLRYEPLLPYELQPQRWAVNELRPVYAELEHRHQQAIRRFLAA